MSVGFCGVLGLGKPRIGPATQPPALHGVYGAGRSLILQIALTQMPKLPLFIELSISFPETYDETSGKSLEIQTTLYILCRNVSTYVHEELKVENTVE